MPTIWYVPLLGIIEDTVDKQDRVLGSKLVQLAQFTTVLAKTKGLLPDVASTEMGFICVAFCAIIAFGDRAKQAHDSGHTTPAGHVDEACQDDLEIERARCQLAALVSLAEIVAEETNATFTVLTTKEFKVVLNHVSRHVASRLSMKIEARARRWTQL